MSYTYLTQDERYQIGILANAGHNQSAIAQEINRQKSTISREFRRNGACAATYPGKPINSHSGTVVDVKLMEDWSPEQISGYLEVNGQPGISVDSFYQRTYADKHAGGTLHQTLRGQKARKKRDGRRERRGIIPNPVWINLRPDIMARRARYGDWEADLVIGAGQKQALVTMNQSTSRYSLIAQCHSRPRKPSRMS